MITFVRFLLGFMLVLSSLFLILLVLIQRGRGGGLTGALGGAGGQSAFGTKAGDVFTRITVGVAAVWIGLCILSLNVLGQRESLFSPTLGGNAPQAITPQTRPAAPPAAGGPPATQVETPAAGDEVVLPDAGSSGAKSPDAPAVPPTPGSTETPPGGTASGPQETPPAAPEPAGSAD